MSSYTGIMSRHHSQTPDTVYKGLYQDIFFDGENVGCTQQTNALTRTRSSGGVKRKRADVAPYYTSPGEYNYARGKTLGQNSTTLLQAGDPSAAPGQPAAASNVYYSGTLTTCPNGNAVRLPVYHHPSNPKFDRQGAVSNSTYLLQLRNNALTYSGPAVHTAYGPILPSALAMSLGANAYRLKDRIGVPAKCTPAASASASSCLPTQRTRPFN